MTYNDDIDAHGKNITKLTHLELNSTSIDGVLESLNPLIFDWSPMPKWDGCAELLNIDVETLNTNYTIETGTERYLSGDINYDGITDVIKTVIVTDNSGKSTLEGLPMLSKINGENLTYVKGQRMKLADLYNYKERKLCGIFNADIDGNGRNDIITVVNKRMSLNHRALLLSVLCAKNGNNADTINSIVRLERTDSEPLFTVFDCDNDGKDEFYCLDNNPSDADDNLYKLTVFGKIEYDNIKHNYYGINNYKYLNIVGRPRRLFCGDYNNDGLIDLLVITDSGYYVFNNVGRFSDTEIPYEQIASCHDYNLKYYKHMEQGDFNGDGLADLIYLEDNGSWINAQIMYNNGNYTFTKGFAGRFFAAPIYNDEMLTMLTSDLNNDGRSDLVIIRQLEKSTSNVVWALMDGLSFKQVKQLDIPSESESKPSNILLGCFNINGGFSVAHVGMYNLYNGSKSPIEKLYIYGNHNVTNDNGKIVNVIDGLGRTTSIEYSSIFDNTIYDNGSEVRYPLCKPMSIIPLVKRIIKNETDITEYKYGGFVHHQIRKGLLSPDYFYSEDLSKKQSISYSVLSRDTITFQPIECLTIKKQGEKQLTSKEYHSIYNITTVH